MVLRTMPGGNFRLQRPIIYIQSPRADLQEGAAKWRKRPRKAGKVSLFSGKPLQLAGAFRCLAKGRCSLQEGSANWRKCPAACSRVSLNGESFLQVCGKVSLNGGRLLRVYGKVSPSGESVLQVCGGLSLNRESLKWSSAAFALKNNCLL